MSEHDEVWAEDPLANGITFEDRHYGRVIVKRHGPKSEPWLFRKVASGDWVTVRAVDPLELPTLLPEEAFLKPGEAFADSPTSAALKALIKPAEERQHG